MHYLGNYHHRQVYWLAYDQLPYQLPDGNWVCLAVANAQPDTDRFDQFVRVAIGHQLLEFKAQGVFAELLHDSFDETIVLMKAMEGSDDIDIMTTWHTDQPLADAFWQCFCATCLPDSADLDHIKILCMDLDGVDRSDELKSCIREFELGWLPGDNYKHEVWQDSNGMTMLCRSDEQGNAARQLLDTDSTMIHSFYAGSHFEAMTHYYQFMGWGIYTSEFEADKEPYM